MVLLDEAEDVFPTGGHGALFQLLVMGRARGDKTRAKPGCTVFWSRWPFR